MFKKVLLPVDHADASSWQQALPVALEQAQQAGAALHIVTVVPEVLGLPNLPADYGSGMVSHATEQLDKLVKEQVSDGVSVSQKVRQGAVYREILAEAESVGADLIVMASHRPELKDYLLGPNAARVVRHAQTSVLVVRS